MAKKFTTVDEYITSFPSDVQELLKKIQKTIRDMVPGATEGISYQIPTFKLDGRYLIYFSAWKDHISLYPVPLGTPEFDKELSKYQTGKGTVQFPLDKPIPYDFIKQMVKFRLEENKGSQ